MHEEKVKHTKPFFNGKSLQNFLLDYLNNLKIMNLKKGL